MTKPMQRCGALLAVLAPLALLAGCATTPAPAQVAPARLDAVHAAVGEPVSSILVTSVTGTSGIYSWQALNDHELLIYTRPTRAWLLQLTPCPRLFDTPFIAVTQSMNQIDGFSNVYVFRGPVRCNVRQIRPVDVSQLDVKMVHRPGASLVSSSGWRDASDR